MTLLENLVPDFLDVSLPHLGDTQIKRSITTQYKTWLERTANMITKFLNISQFSTSKVHIGAGRPGYELAATASV